LAIEKPALILDGSIDTGHLTMCRTSGLSDYRANRLSDWQEIRLTRILNYQTF